MVDAQNTSTISAETESDTKSKGTSVGVTLAFNTIGMAPQNFLFNTIDALFGTDIASEQPAQTRAYIENSEIRAAGGVSVTTLSAAEIDATIGTSATAIVASLGPNTTVAVGAVVTLNKISTDVEARIEGSSIVEAAQGDIQVTAENLSEIDTDLTAPAASVAAGLGNSIAVAIGVGVARNEIRNDLEAFIRNSGSVANPVKASAGSVVVRADNAAQIDARASASAISLALSIGSSTPVSGGGAIAVNTILGRGNAFIEGSTVTAEGSGPGQGGVDLDATNASRDGTITSKIDARVESSAVAGGASVGSTKAIAIGFSMARNLIGWEATSTAAAEHLSTDTPASVVTGDKVRIAEGVRAGDVYEYVGLDTLNDPNLTEQAYSDETRWRQVVNASSAEVKAYIEDSAVTAAGGVSLAALADSGIDATVTALAAGVGASAGSGGSLSGAGVLTENKIRTDVQAYIDGDDVKVVRAGSVALTANDASGISAVAGAASLAASLAGGTSGALSVGVSVARNEVRNRVEAYVQDQELITTSGDVALSATSQGQHLFDLTLAGLSVTTAELDDASRQDQDDPDDPNNPNDDKDDPEDDAVNEAMQDADDDQAILEKLRTEFANNATTLSGELRLSILEEGDLGGEAWTLVDGEGASFVIRDAGGVLAVSQATISAVSAAASLAASFGGTTGVALSGAGAEATNVVVNKTNAYLSNSRVTSAGDVNLAALGTSGITATVVAASAAIGGGGTTGVGASIGAAV
ncbi:MAG: hypothetical protein ACYTGC_18935, partial [Planctomycetota bacterium]